MELVSGKVVQGCSNAGNPFHECTSLCLERLNSGDVHKKEKKLFGMMNICFFILFFIVSRLSIILIKNLLKHDMCQVLVRELQAGTLLQAVLPLLVEADRLWPAISQRRRLSQTIHLPMITPMVTSSVVFPRYKDARPNPRTSLQTMRTRSPCRLLWLDIQGETILQGG